MHYRYDLGAPRGGHSTAGSTIQRRRRVGISCCSSVSLAICQGYTEPIKQRLKTNLPALWLGNPVKQTARRTPLRGVTAAMNLP